MTPTDLIKRMNRASAGPWRYERVALEGWAVVSAANRDDRVCLCQHEDDAKLICRVRNLLQHFIDLWVAMQGIRASDAMFLGGGEAELANAEAQRADVILDRLKRDE